MSEKSALGQQTITTHVGGGLVGLHSLHVLSNAIITCKE